MNVSVRYRVDLHPMTAETFNLRMLQNSNFYSHIDLISYVVPNYVETVGYVELVSMIQCRQVAAICYSTSK